MEPGSDWSSYLEKIAAANNEAALAAVEQALFGRKAGALTLALGALKDVPPEERKNVAADLNDWKKKLQTAIDAKRAALSSPADSELADRDKLDVTLSLPEKPRGHLHPIPEFIRQVEKVFGRMGFDVAYGPEIEEEQYNFNLLNIPDDHPARDTQDTFWIKDVPNRLLRTQTSPVQIHYMKEYKPPFRMICPGKVYRKDADATHSPMFHQFEGLMIGKDVNLANMKAVMETAVRELIRPDAEFRFRTGYFPFVEPGLEMDMRWPPARPPPPPLLVGGPASSGGPPPRPPGGAGAGQRMSISSPGSTKGK